ncbi:MAG TPA: hypothetical protein VNF68_12875 [Candidatus Baltobacteraceae bacterium]|nr:hypothetical protein [Candidatus Baltobacteraceae bacterium]
MTKRFTSLALVVATFAIAFALTSSVARADVRSVYHGGTYWGSVRVEPGQVVDGDLDVILGNVENDGQINGDVNVVGGNINNNGTITGQTHVLGGEVVDTIVPWAPFARSNATSMVDDRLWWRITWDVVVLVVFLIFPVRTRMALGRLEAHPGLATAAGLFGWVAALPIMFLLAVTIVLIPLIPVEAVLLAAAVFVGHAALALLIGKRFYELLQPTATPTPLVALVLGIVLLTAAELVPVVGILVTLLVGLIGVGAVILTFVAQPTTALGAPPTGPPISGPPMTIG